MALHVIQSPIQASARGFVAQLIKNLHLKPGFAQILSGRDLVEIERYLLEKNLIDRDKLAKEYADFFKLPFIHLTNQPIEPEVASMLPVSVAEQYKIIPYKIDGPNFYLAIGKPAKLQSDAPKAILAIRQQKGLHIHLAVAPEAEVTAVIHKLLDRQKESNPPAPAEPVLAPPVASKPEVTEVLKPAEAASKPEAKAEPEIIAKTAEAVKPLTNVPVVRSFNKKDLIEEVEPRSKHVDLRRLEIPKEVLEKIPYDVAKKYQIIVFDSSKPTSTFEPPQIKVAIVNPEDAHVKEILSYIESRNKILIDRYTTDQVSFQAAVALYPNHKVEKESLPESPPKAEPAKEEKKPVDQLSPKEVAEALKPYQNNPDLPKVNQEPLAVKEPPAVTTVPVPKSPPLPAVVEERPVKNDQPKTPSEVQADAKLSDQGVTIKDGEIRNRPSQDSAVEIQRAINTQQTSLEDQDLDKLLKQAPKSVEELAAVYRSGVIPEIVAATLFLAIQMKASDVHVEAEQDTMRIRYRIDGILHDILRVPAFLHAPLTSRVKILAKMKIDEQRVPQDGRFDVKISNRQVDLRVSTMPTVHGEKVVMRLLDKSAGIMSLEQLGVTGSNFDTLIDNINKPYGIILSTGPTGSGKSTTLYAILTRISKPGVNIVTLEDPVEYELPGINQAQIKPQIGFTFAEGLRSVLRQDPNVIMVGEIRDLETAAMATHSALTGHLVLSTLHTNDAAGALPRLINMGVEPFLITSSINAVVGQRLVRRVCDDCREQVEIPSAVKNFVQKQLSAVPSGQLKSIDLDQLVFYHGRGCPNCTNGYRGRIGIFEVLPMTDKIEDLAVRKETANVLKAEAIKEGMITMMQDGLMKALKGITTVDEVMRVTTASIKESPGV